MEKPKRAQRRKPATDQGGPAATVWLYCGGQGVHREVESEGLAEKFRAVIDGGHPADEPVGQRWDKVEPALWRRRRSHSPTVPRCLRAARNRRITRDLRRTGRVGGGHRRKRAYKPAGERASEAGPVVGRLQRYHKRGESRVTEPIGDRNGSGKAAGVRRLGRERKPEEQGREGGTVPWGKTRTFSIEETGGLA
jgi:hypothetical protein